MICIYSSGRAILSAKHPDSFEVKQMIGKYLIKPYKTILMISAFFACFLISSLTCDRIGFCASIPGSETSPEQLPGNYFETPAQFTDPVDEFLSRSAFVGNSISVGLSLYNSRRDNIPLGGATMLAKESYSFVNDFKANTPYLPSFNGKPMRAKDAIKESGARYIFICMGTNDLVGNAGAENALNNFKIYISEILEENPGITIFVESCTPARPTSNVVNSKILAFNSYVKNYCDIYPGVYYIDIASPMSDPEGYLQPEFASDGSCHLSNAAYASWTETVRSYIRDYIEQNAAVASDVDEFRKAAVQRNYRHYLRKLEEMKRSDQILRSTSSVDRF